MSTLTPLFEASLRGALLIGILALLRVPIRRLIGSPWLCSLWLVVLIRLLLPGSVQSSWSVFTRDLAADRRRWSHGDNCFIAACNIHASGEQRSLAGNRLGRWRGYDAGDVRLAHIQDLSNGTVYDPAGQRRTVGGI
jgi:hypothetical protein